MPLTDNDIALWQARYQRAYIAFVRGAITSQEASSALMDLRYRDEALRIELQIWENAKRKRRNRAAFAARQKLGLIIGSTNEPTQDGEAAP
jgi:hypothetical protein